MKFVNDITHAQLLTLNELAPSKEPLRFRNLVLMFCERGELLDLVTDRANTTLIRRVQLHHAALHVLALEKCASKC